MSEEADSAIAVLPRLAKPGTVSLRMQPELKDAMREGAKLSSAAITFSPELGAGDAFVGDAARISALGFLSAVGVWAEGPVMAFGLGAALDLVGVHPEVV